MTRKPATGRPERHPGTRAPSSAQQTLPEPSDAAARSKSAAGLVIVGTPIGNAVDISRRAVDTLAGAAIIACEDTRVTGPLMARYGIHTPLVPYHEHNAARMRPLLLERLSRGESVALVSDAGMPLVSDPGYKLVRAAIEAGLSVTVVPGPSAPLAALVVSGLPTDRFLFAGFLPQKSAARRAMLAELAPVRATLLIFESAGRLAQSLADMAAMLGPREAAVARELTKLFEEVRRGTLADLAAHYAVAGPPKGEIVVVIGPPGEAEPPSGAEIDAALGEALARASLRDAVAEIVEATGRPRREIYARALALSRSRSETEGQ